LQIFMRQHGNGVEMAGSLLENRREAGNLLAWRLEKYAGRSDVVVLALPRGGVPVGFSIAEALWVPLDVLPVRKVSLPGHEEFAVGAVASGGASFIATDPAEKFGVDEATLKKLIERKLHELEKIEQAYRAYCPRQLLEGRVVILVDDGIATGATMRAAVAAVRVQRPACVVMAVPVAARDTFALLRAEVDEAVCLMTPEHFYAVSCWYEVFDQVPHGEAEKLLRQARRCLQPEPFAGRDNARGQR
jgi:putative phosphoribosyl transferase